MEFRRIIALRGPNIWARFPVLEAWVELGDLKDSPSDSISGFNDRLIAWLPGMIEHRCSVGERGGFFQRLRDGTYPAHILEHVTLELQNLTGVESGFGRARETSQEGLFRVAVRYEDEAVGRACLEAGRRLFLAAVNSQPFDIDAEVKQLRALARRVRIGPSTRAMIEAAKARGIPVQRLSDTQMLFQLGHGVRQRRINRSATEHTSSVAEALSDEKDVTKAYLRSAGIPIAAGRLVTSPEDAWQAALEVGPPVVVKPSASNYGNAVVIGISQREHVEDAYKVALTMGGGVLVEKLALGVEHRLLVVDGKFVAATRGNPAIIVGDGRQTVTELIESQLNSDPRRGDGPQFPLAKVEFDANVRLVLEQEGYTPTSVPKAGTKVIIQRSGNLAFDETDEVHPDTARTVELAARVIGLDVAGIDIIAEDIGRPLAEQGGVILEVNSTPGLAAHVEPEVGTPRPVGDAIMNTIFAPGENGRIPLVAVLGHRATIDVSRLIANLLRVAGHTAGLATAEGISIGTQQIHKADCRGAEAARSVLMNPTVDAAVLETSLESIVTEGLGFDRCKIAVITSMDDGYKLDFAECDTEHKRSLAFRGASDMVLDDGAVVMRAGEPLAPLIIEHCPGKPLLFSLDAKNESLVAHRAAGGRAVWVDGEQVVFAAGQGALSRVSLGQAPSDERLLASVAALWALGYEPDKIAGWATGLAKVLPSGKSRSH